MSYPDHLIWAWNPTGATVAKLDVSSMIGAGFAKWRMSDEAITTYWKGAKQDTRIKIEFEFPIIFQKLVIVKRVDQQKLR